MSTLATDAFTRANAVLNTSPWSAVSTQGTMSISSNTAVPTDGTHDAAARYSNITWPNNQWAQANISPNSAGGGSGYGILLRCSSSAITYYRCVCDKAASNNMEIGYFSAGTFNSLAVRSITVVTNSVLYVEIQGTQIVVKVDSTTVTPAIPTNATIGSGQAGISYSSDESGGSMDNFSGGDFATTRVMTGNVFLQAVSRGAMF